MIEPWKVIFIIVLVAILVVYSYIRLGTSLLCKDLFGQMTRQDAHDYYYLLFTIDNLFKEKDILYSATRSTVLGMVRHKGVVPWVKGYDLLVFEKDLEKIKGMRDDFTKKGMSLDIFQMTVSYKDKKLNLYGFREEGNKLYHVSENLRNTDFFTQDELYPIRRYVFGDIYIQGPDKPIPYLQRTYGKNILTECSSVSNKNIGLRMRDIDYKTVYTNR